MTSRCATATGGVIGITIGNDLRSALRGSKGPFVDSTIGDEREIPEP